LIAAERAHRHELDDRLPARRPALQQPVRGRRRRLRDGVVLYSQTSVRDFAIRNVTAIDAAPRGIGLSVATESSTVTLTARSVIAKGRPTST